MIAQILLVALFLAWAAGGCTYLVRQWLKGGNALPMGPFGFFDAAFASLLALVLIYLVATSAGVPQQVTEAGILASAILYLGFVGFIVIGATLRGLSLTEVFGTRWERWPQGLKFSAACFLAMLPLVGVAQWMSAKVLGGAAQVQPLLEFWMHDASLQGRVLVVMMAVVAAPLAEEFIFRGYLFRVGRRYLGTVGSMVATSLLFAAIHVHLPALPGLFVLAMGLSFLYLRTGSIWAPVLAHAVFNSVSLVSSLLWPELA